MKRYFRELYRFATIRAVVHRYGPAVWRLSPVLRRHMQFSADAMRRLPAAQTWQWRTAEWVRPVPLDGPTLGHRIASRPHRMPPSVVGQLPQAWLAGRHAAVVTDRGRLVLGAFRDSAGILGIEANEDLVEWLAAGGWTQRQERSPWADLCPLVSRLDANYFHWIAESCGQVEGLEAFERATGIRPKVLIRHGGAAYLRSSLELLGITPERIVEWRSEDEPQPVDRLVMVSRPGNNVACSPASLRWLRERFLAAAGVRADGITADKLLYIPRKQRGWRYVANEDELLPPLLARGFEVVQAEDLTLADQIRLFSRAKLLVGLHGAGLTNILFAPHAKLLELFGAYGDGLYYSVSSGLGQPYRSLRFDPQTDEVVVDVPRVLQTIDEMLRPG